MSKRSIILVLLIAIAIVAGAVVYTRIPSAPSGGKKIVIDMAGRSVTVPERPERVIAVGGGALRIITYLDATNRVIGVEDVEKTAGRIARPYVLAHPELTDLPSVGPRHGGDAELIAALEPEVIILTRWREKIDDLQDRAGAPVVFLGDSEPDLDEMYESLRLAGSVLDREARAEELIRYTESLVRDLEQRAGAAEERPKVYVGGMGQQENGILETRMDYIPFQLLDAKTLDEMPGVELPPKVKEGQVAIDPEILLEWKPEYIFIDAGGHAMQDLDRPEFVTLSSAGVFQLLPYRDYGDNFETIFVDAYAIGKALYPEEFEDVNMEEKADEIYSTFVGAPVYDEMCGIWGL
jgi:iron complex transport system substrate-binding protein